MQRGIGGMAVRIPEPGIERLFDKHHHQRGKGAGAGAAASKRGVTGTLENREGGNDIDRSAVA